MSDISVEEYKKFIDALVEVANESTTTTLGRIQKGMNVFSQHPNSEEQRKETIVASLSSKQKEVVVELLLGERQVIIGEILAFFAWRRYRISHGTTPLAVEPFDTDFSYDFGARLDGSLWPNEDPSSHE